MDENSIMDGIKTMDDLETIGGVDNMGAVGNMDNMDNIDGMDNMDNMDDLFMEAQPTLQPNVTLDKALLKRLDEFTITGCCKKVAWSKIGAVAQIAEDGSVVKVNSFAQDYEKGGFGFTDSTSLELPDDVTLPISNIAWSVAGHELVVVDSIGKVIVYTTVVALNTMSRVALQENIVQDQPEALGVVVGLEWLLPLRPWAIYASASHGENGWTYTPSPQRAKGPTHPMTNKGAMLLVTRGSSLRLLYQSYSENDKKYYNASVQLGNADCTDYLLTHASFGLEPDNSALLVTYDYSFTIRVYRVKVTWNFNPQSGQQQISETNGNIVPTLEVVRLKELRSISAQPGELLHQSSEQLTHLQLLPSTAEPTSKQAIPPSVVAVFTMTDTSMSLPGAARPRSSRIARWELREEQERLHSSFEALSSSNGTNPNATSKTIVDLKRMDDIELPSLVVAIHLLRISTVVAFTLSDSRVEYRDRPAMQVVQISDGAWPNHLSTLVNAGFAFSSGAPCIDMAMSPNNCFGVTKGLNDDLSIKSMEHQSLMDANVPQNKDAATAALAMVFATSCVQLHNNDDLLALTQRHLHLVGVENILDAMFIAISIPLDFSAPESHEKLMKSPIVLRCLSIQCSLGKQVNSQSLSSKTAWITMNLRAAYWTFHIGLSTAGQEHKAQSDLPSSLLGVIAWYFDLMVVIIDELMTISRNVHGREGEREVVQKEVASLNSGSLCLLLSVISRIFLRYNCRYIRSLYDTARKLSVNPAHRDSKAWSTFIALVNSSPVNAYPFEQALAEIDHHVKDTFEKAGYAEPQRTAAERHMLITGEPPEVLMPVVQRLLTTTLNKLLDEIDPLEVYSKDVSWLGVTDDAAGVDPDIALLTGGAAPPKTAQWDVHRKVPLTGVKKLRKCTRCGSFMEHFMPRGMTAWILIAQKSCVCGNFWVVVDT